MDYGNVRGGFWCGDGGVYDDNDLMMMMVIGSGVNDGDSVYSIPIL